MTDKITTITLNWPAIDDFAHSRNKAMAKVNTDWVLFADKDEVVSSALKAEIDRVIKDKGYNYQLKRQDIFLGKKLRFGETAAVRLTRLVQKDSGKWQGKVHEVFQSKLPLKTLNNPLIHQRDLTVSKFISRLNRYTDIKAQELVSQGHTFKLHQLLLWPGLKFLQNYLLRLGFLDGVQGLIMAFSMSLHSLMVRVKIYELTRKTN